ncbi:MAG: hypothetical protein V1708_02270 [Candidatus Micrarchaeota archaeon]
MASIELLEKEINVLKERNRRVEADKAWETGTARRAMIFLLTYAVIVVFFVSARLPDPFANSLVPAIAFALSGLSLPFFKKVWLARC